jgi:hypothetical protein
MAEITPVSEDTRDLLEQARAGDRCSLPPRGEDSKAAIHFLGYRAKARQGQQKRARAPE